MKLYIKNMKCSRCKFLVKSELEKLGLQNVIVKAGEVEIHDSFSEEKKALFRNTLKELDMELTNDKDIILVERIKSVIHEVISDSSDPVKTNLSEEISGKLGYNYNYLSNKFSDVAGISIKQYFIRQKVFHVKEMLVHENLSLSQIAYNLNYNSVSHLSSQFKKETGITPSHFREKYQPGNHAANPLE